MVHDGQQVTLLVGLLACLVHVWLLTVGCRVGIGTMFMVDALIQDPLHEALLLHCVSSMWVTLFH
jgi:hypothetical protein